MIKFLHAADLHLDSPLISAQDPVLRRAALRQTARRIFDLAQREEVDIILLAGDLFDNASPFADTVELIKMLTRKAGVSVFISPGNHDCCRAGSAYLDGDWGENVHIFKSTKLEKVSLPHLGISVWGSAFINEEKYGDPLEHFKVDDENINIVLLHAELTGGSSKYCPLTVNSIDASGADYVALGHIHKFSSGTTPSGTVWAQPGCPEGRGFDETGDKGVIIGEIAKGNVKLRFERVCSARYFDIEVSLDAGDDPVEKCLETIKDCTVNDICRITLAGQSEKADTLAIKTAASEHCGVHSVKDTTYPSKELFDGAIEQSLKGRFLARMKQAYESAPTEKEKLSAALAVRFGLAALEGRQPPQSGAYYEN